MWESEFLFRPETALVTYQGKRTQNGILLSKKPNKAKLSQDNNEPEIVLHYNKTKGRVVRYKSNNGPDDTRIYLKQEDKTMVMFFNMVDLASTASRAVFRTKFPMKRLSHEDKLQRFNLEASRALGHCTYDTPCINPDPARTGEAEHLYHSKNTAACRDLSTKKDKER